MTCTLGTSLACDVQSMFVVWWSWPGPTHRGETGFTMFPWLQVSKGFLQTSGQRQFQSTLQVARTETRPMFVYFVFWKGDGQGSKQKEWHARAKKMRTIQDGKDELHSWAWRRCSK